MTDTGHTSDWVGEGGTRTETSTATVHKVDPTVGTLYAYPKATEESLQDINFDVNKWFVDETSKEFALQVGAAIVNGNGTDKPTGFLQASTSSSNDTSSPQRPFGTVEYIPTGFAADFGGDRTSSPVGNSGDVLFDTFYALNEFHRQNATWLMNSLTWSTVRKWKDADGNPLWERGFTGTPASLLGHPVRICEAMSDIGSNTFSIAVADWKAAYLLVNVAGLRLTVDDNITTPGQYKLYARQRMGGQIMDSSALKLIKCATS